MSADWVPTAKLRWVNRAVGDTDRGPGRGLIPLEYERVLQVWYSQDVPGYMRRDADGEWRDVVVEEETAP